MTSWQLLRFAKLRYTACMRTMQQHLLLTNSRVLTTYLTLHMNKSTSSGSLTWMTTLLFSLLCVTESKFMLSIKVNLWTVKCGRPCLPRWRANAQVSFSLLSLFGVAFSFPCYLDFLLLLLLCVAFIPVLFVTVRGLTEMQVRPRFWCMNWTSNSPLIMLGMPSRYFTLNTGAKCRLRRHFQTSIYTFWWTPR